MPTAFLPDFLTDLRLWLPALAAGVTVGFCVLELRRRKLEILKLEERNRTVGDRSPGRLS